MTIIKLADNLTDLPKMPEFTRNQWKELNKGKFVKGHEEYVDDAQVADIRKLAFQWGVDLIGW